ncbi:MAG: RNA polymerase sigma factor [Angelakisella sp.]
MKNTTISEQELLFRSVYDTYQKAVYRIAYSILHDEGAAEDTVQLTFLKLYHELDRIGEVHSGKARAFVIVLARNTAIDQYRKRRREQTVYFEDLANVPQSSDSSPEWTKSTVLFCCCGFAMATAIRRLPPSWG